MFFMMLHFQTAPFWSLSGSTVRQFSLADIASDDRFYVELDKLACSVGHHVGSTLQNDPNLLVNLLVE